MTPREILDRLVAFDTVSRNSNTALIDWVRDYLAGHGVESRLIPDADGGKANLFATLAPSGGHGAGHRGGVLLSGHTDVVPVDGQAWSTDPFSVVEKDGRLYGRGTADMKGFLALVLAIVPDALAAGLKTPIHLAFSYDEEVGCTGVPDLIAGLGDGLPMPALAIVGEPTGMRLVNAHKGVCALRTTVTGSEAHSSRAHLAASAITAAARAIAFLDDVAAELREGPLDPLFDPPFTTLSVGLIEGGAAVNIVPGRCSFEWDIRTIPGADPGTVIDRLREHAETELLPAMRAVAPEADIRTEAYARVAPLQPQEGSPAEALVQRLTGRNRTETVAFGSEAGLFQEAGVPTVLCGPGEIAQAHQPDEYIEIGQFEAGEAFIRALVDWAADTPEW